MAFNPMEVDGLQILKTLRETSIEQPKRYILIRHFHVSVCCLLLFFFVQRQFKPSAAPSAPSGLVVPPLAPPAPPNPPAPPAVPPLAPPAPPNHPAPPAPKGLPNLGSTCYLNSSVQCLLSFPQFQNYFLPDCYRQGLNAANLNGNSTCFEFLIESEAVYVNRIIPTRSGLKGHAIFWSTCGVLMATKIVGNKHWSSCDRV